MTGNVSFPSFGSLSFLGYDCVFCIHEILGRMDEFSHGLRLLLIELMDEQVRIDPVMEGCQHQFIIHLVHSKGFSVETSNEGPQALIFPLLYC